MSLVSITSTGTAAAQSDHRTGESNLIVIARESSRPGKLPVLDLIRQRLPVGVHSGRFAAQEGESTFCILSRRQNELNTSQPGPDGEQLPVCPMIPVYLDNVAVSDPSALLANARGADLQSIELVSDTDASKRYGISDEVLALWTRGCGPYARPEKPGVPRSEACHTQHDAAPVNEHAGSAAGGGYLFQKPRVTLTVRGGASVPLAGDDLHRMFREQLTLARRDFVSATFGADLGVRAGSRVELVASVAHARAEMFSNFRDWVDANDVTIDQTTLLRQTPLTLNARLFLRDDGRSVSRHAWVPARFLPYVGLGAGVIWYELEQSGWFVDFQDLDIFEDTFFAEGSAPVATAFAGTEWWPALRFGLTLEGRYSYARARLQPDFTDFDKIDLSGFQVTAGLSVRF